VCGPTSAIGLDDSERELWPLLRERLRQPGRMMALMRGLLGADAEVAAVVAVEPAGVVRPLALVVTPGIAAEITLADDADSPDDPAAPRRGHIGEYDVDVLVGVDAEAQPVAVLVNPWIFENLTLFTRKLWSRR
jgi:orotate phosphoribosyltransferase-like protein